MNYCDVGASPQRNTGYPSALPPSSSSSSSVPVTEDASAATLSPKEQALWEGVPHSELTPEQRADWDKKEGVKTRASSAARTTFSQRTHSGSSGAAPSNLRDRGSLVVNLAPVVGHVITEAQDLEVRLAPVNQDLVVHMDQAKEKAEKDDYLRRAGEYRTGMRKELREKSELVLPEFDVKIPLTSLNLAAPLNKLASAFNSTTWKWIFTAALVAMIAAAVLVFAFPVAVPFLAGMAIGGGIATGHITIPIMLVIATVGTHEFWGKADLLEANIKDLEELDKKQHEMSEDKAFREFAKQTASEFKDPDGKDPGEGYKYGYYRHKRENLEFDTQFYQLWKEDNLIDATRNAKVYKQNLENVKRDYPADLGKERHAIIGLNEALRLQQDRMRTVSKYIFDTYGCKPRPSSPGVFNRYDTTETKKEIKELDKRAKVIDGLGVEESSEDDKEAVDERGHVLEAQERERKISIASLLPGEPPPPPPVPTPTTEKELEERIKELDDQIPNFEAQIHRNPEGSNVRTKLKEKIKQAEADREKYTASLDDLRKQASRKKALFELSLKDLEAKKYASEFAIFKHKKELNIDGLAPAVRAEIKSKIKKAEADRKEYLEVLTKVRKDKGVSQPQLTEQDLLNNIHAIETGVKVDRATLRSMSPSSQREELFEKINRGEFEREQFLEELNRIQSTPRASPGAAVPPLPVGAAPPGPAPRPPGPALHSSAAAGAGSPSPVGSAPHSLGGGSPGPAPIPSPPSPVPHSSPAAGAGFPAAASHPAGFVPPAFAAPPPSADDEVEMPRISQQTLNEMTGIREKINNRDTPEAEREKLRKDLAKLAGRSDKN